MKEITAYISNRGCIHATEKEAYRDDTYVLLRKILEDKEVLNIDTLLDNSVAISDVLTHYNLKNE